MAIIGKDSLYEANAGVDITAHTPSGTGATGGSWSYLGGGGTVSLAGGGFHSGSAQGGSAILGAAQSANSYAQIDMVLYGSYGGVLLICDKTTIGGGGYVFSRNGGATGTWEIDKYTDRGDGNAGSATLLTISAPYSDNTTYTLRLERVVSGSSVTLTAYINGSQVGQVTDSSSAWTGPAYGGLNGYQPSGTTTKYFNFETGTLPSPLTAGTSSTTSSGNTIATVTVGNASGGTGPYSYQWYRSTTSGFTPGSGNIVSGATSQTLNDTGLTNGTTYYYANVVNDSASNKATSNQTSATPVNIILPNDPHFAYCGRWNVGSSVAITINNGAEVEFAVTGNSCTLYFDVSTVSTAGVGNYPVVAYSVDGAAQPRIPLTSTGKATLTIPNSGTAHIIRFTTNIDSCYTESGPNNWNSLTQATKFLGISVDSGATLLAIPNNPNTIEFLGDSITAGLRVLYTGTNGNLYDAVELSWARRVASLLGLKPIINGHGGQGIGTSSTDGTPNANSAFGYVYNGVSWNPSVKPVVVFVYMGTNDGPGFTQSQYTTYLQTIRSAYPKAYIFAAVPYNVTDGRKSTISASVSALNDPRIFYYDYSNLLVSADTVDSIHPGVGGCVKMAAAIASDIQAKLTSLGVSVQSVLTPVYAAATNVRNGVDRGDGTVGTLVVPSAANVLSSTTYDGSTAGTAVLPPANKVQNGTVYGAGGNSMTGTLSAQAATYASASNVRNGIDRGDGTIGSLVVPAASKVLSGTTYDAGTQGTATLPAASNVLSGTVYGAGGNSMTGTLSANSGPTAASIASAVVSAMASAPVGSVANPVALDQSKPLQVAPEVGTVGEALAAMRAESVGKAIYDPVSKTFSLYAHDGTTILHVSSVTTDANGNLLGRAA